MLLKTVLMAEADTSVHKLRFVHVPSDGSGRMVGADILVHANSEHEALAHAGRYFNHKDQVRLGIPVNEATLFGFLPVEDTEIGHYDNPIVKRLADTVVLTAYYEDNPPPTAAEYAVQFPSLPG